MFIAVFIIIARKKYGYISNADCFEILEEETPQSDRYQFSKGLFGDSSRYKKNKELSIMAKKRSIDPGLQYLMDIGFDRIRGKYGLSDRFIKVFGKKRAEEIWKTWESLPVGSREFYDFKNSDSQISKAFSEAYDGDIIRKACNYIDSHKDYFGPTILEVGCDCGVISCFLANIFPEAKIVAIDRCPNAIEIARKFAQDRGVENITFIESDLKDIKETFDTVFSMRTVHENIASDEDIINDLGEQAEIFKDGLYEYASALSNVLSSQGTLISIERIGRNALLLGWMKALDEADLVFDLTCYEELICNEAGDKSVFQAFASFKGIESEIEAKDLFDFACSKYLDYSKAQYEGWEAKIVFENRRGTLIEGYNLVYTTPVAKVRASLWTHKTDETCLVMYQNNNGVVSTTFHDVSLKEELLKSLHNAIEESQKYGNVTITQMS